MYLFELYFRHCHACVLGVIALVAAVGLSLYSRVWLDNLIQIWQCSVPTVASSRANDHDSITENQLLPHFNTV